MANLPPKQSLKRFLELLRMTDMAYAKILKNGISRSTRPGRWNI